MKKTNVLILFISSILITYLTSCSDDFLNQSAVGVYSDDNINDKKGINQLLIGAYAAINGNYGSSGFTYLSSAPQGAILGVIHGGEALKGGSISDLGWILEFSQFQITAGNDGVLGMYTYYYDAVFRCNLVLKNVTEVLDLTVEEATQIIAETRFLRGHYYFMLKRAFKNIPWIDETVTDVRVPNTDENGNYVDIWPQITEDFDFARQNLPETQPDLGRPNKWAAECYYAKVLIYRANEDEYAAGYTEALEVLNNTIQNGVTAKGEKYALLDNYYFNFSAANENGPESVFAVQHSANDGSSFTTRWGLGINGNVEGVLYSTQASDGPGWGKGFGFYQPSLWYADHFRVDDNGLPFLDMFETNPIRLKTDDGLNVSTPFTPGDSPIDPRLDWSVGRRGIPFLDFGLMPGKSWVRAQAENGPYILKKWFIKKSENGLYCVENVPFNAINYCIIRYADVLLLAAECEAKVGDLNKARNLVNQVRNRMVQNSASPDNWVKLDDDVTHAANYKIGLYPTGEASDPFKTQEGALDAILYERTLELGFEGHRFYDVVRFGKGEKEFNGLIASEKERFSFLEGTEYTEVPDRYLPIPTNAIDKSQKGGVATLKQNPGY